MASYMMTFYIMAFEELGSIWSTTFVEVQEDNYDLWSLEEEPYNDRVDLLMTDFGLVDLVMTDFGLITLVGIRVAMGWFWAYVAFYIKA